MSRSTSTRRDFAKTMTALAAVPLVGGQAPAQSAPADTAAVGLIEVLRLRHGHLSAEQLRRLRAQLQANLDISQRLRAFPLTSGDEPVFQYSADVP